MGQEAKNIINQLKKIKHLRDKKKNKESFQQIPVPIFRHNMEIVQN
jgi:hypothetical protein